MLEIRDLHVSYGKIEAVRGVSASAAPGRITLVLGANGAGKTTTLRAAMGLLPVRSGEVVLDGTPVTGRPTHRIVREGLALVPEGRQVFAPLTVEENLTLGGYTVSREKASGTLERAYEMFPILKERRNGPAGLLSGGEQQMLAFGRALMSSPRAMMLDEPSMGLAPTMVESVFGAVRTIADSGIALLMVEQNADMGLEIADDVVVVARGEVVFSGPAEQARRNTSVVRAFLGEAALGS
ncbi:ABC transporter ATP-binding protein [Thermobifida alba]|uniref:ABC transporter ATP-binding protein n=1 Tax=Thermobifida alba TaxID=53522 RepID=A0ABY4KXJ1_THEAE|nr:ABC transporter ATP-binding protein [Thermobifida alba]UPT20145.1 ABC transporter ATP-binding protein [Thermobifida alba]